MCKPDEADLLLLAAAETGRATARAVVTSRFVWALTATGAAVTAVGFGVYWLVVTSVTLPAYALALLSLYAVAATVCAVRSSRARQEAVRYTAAPVTAPATAEAVPVEMLTAIEGQYASFAAFIAAVQEHGVQVLNEPGHRQEVPAVQAAPEQR